eukprot:10931105-Alexandrium_andersonii.AAC.1
MRQCFRCNPSGDREARAAFSAAWPLNAARCPSSSRGARASPSSLCRGPHNHAYASGRAFTPQREQVAIARTQRTRCGNKRVVVSHSDAMKRWNEAPFGH